MPARFMTTSLINAFYLYDASYFEFYHVRMGYYLHEVNSVHFCLYYFLDTL